MLDLSAPYSLSSLGLVRCSLSVPSPYQCHQSEGDHQDHRSPHPHSSRSLTRCNAPSHPARCMPCQCDDGMHMCRMCRIFRKCTNAPASTVFFIAAEWFDLNSCCALRAVKPSMSLAQFITCRGTFTELQ